MVIRHIRTSEFHRRIIDYLAIRGRTIVSQKGFTLVDTLLGMAILVIVGVGLLASLTLSSRVVSSTDTTATAKDLAIAQMEHIKHLPYASDYEIDAGLVPAGSNYEVVIEHPVPLEDGNLQEIIVVINRNGHEVMKLEDYKVNWE